LAWTGELGAGREAPCFAAPADDGPSPSTRRQNATIEVIIEADGFNNSLAGYMACPNGRKLRNAKAASVAWHTQYLEDGEQGGGERERARI
jgi:hypothetical protein